ncbi:MAG: methyltransferase domain-containing protein, partial [Victivallales bacterium]|nr:methyltransferase domain-containing protein [Victivallales bacterium]
LDKAGKILDLGCGIGANTQYLIERGYHVLSADYSREALKSIERLQPITPA